MPDLDLVQTALGPIPITSLGRTLMHEHVFVLTPEVIQNYGQTWWNEDHRQAEAVAKLSQLASSGITTIVDPTVIGLGRYLPRIVQINQQVPQLNIVVATGLYAASEVPSYYSCRGPGTLLGGPEMLTESFIADLQSGIGDTGVRAALLKFVVEHPVLSKGTIRIAHAISDAHLVTGAPITVHTNAVEQTGRQAAAVLQQNGVDLAKVVIGHCGDSNDIDYLQYLMDLGCTIGMDRFGLDQYNSTTNRIDAIVRLCELGYADRMVLSHDAGCFMDAFEGQYDSSGRLREAPDWHYLFISEKVIPELLRRGIDQTHIDAMLINNPLRYFSNVAERNRAA